MRGECRVPCHRRKLVAISTIADSGAAGAFTNNFFLNGSTPSVSKQYDIKLDHNFSSMWHTSGRVSHSWNSNTPLNNFGDPKLAVAEWSNWTLKPGSTFA